MCVDRQVSVQVYIDTEALKKQYAFYYQRKRPKEKEKIMLTVIVYKGYTPTPQNFIHT